VALLLQLMLRIRHGTRSLQVHGLFLLLMVPLGFHWVPHGALVRTWSGLLYGFAVVLFLGLLPAAYRPGVAESGGRTRWFYAAGVVTTLVVVPALAAWGGRGAAGMLAVTAGVGLGGLGVLALANLGIGLGWMRSRWRLRHLRTAP
jgi:hypothetical protein